MTGNELIAGPPTTQKTTRGYPQITRVLGDRGLGETAISWLRRLAGGLPSAPELVDLKDESGTRSGVSNVLKVLTLHHHQRPPFSTWTHL